LFNLVTDISYHVLLSNGGRKSKCRNAALYNNVMMPLWHAALLALVSMALAAIEPGMMRLLSSEMTFVSRPDLRPPRWNITTSNAERLSPGYWFIAPYADLGAQSGSASSCQIGPHIYDDEGVYKVEITRPEMES